MVQRRLDEAATMMGGTVTHGDPRRMWRGVAIDSRRVVGGELFFALRGEHSDGHEFVQQAVSRGAAGAVIERAVEPVGSAALIELPSAYDGLHRLTVAVREQLAMQVVAITGSAGKTSTKELLAAILASTYRTAKSPGNLNNLYGFPISLLGTPDDAEWMVAEMGMSTPGELGEISRLGRPDAVVFTNVGAAHLESFGTVQAIAEAKAEILEGLAPDGLVIANGDDPEVARIARRWDGRVFWYGLDREDADCRALNVRARKPFGSRFELLYDGQEVPIELPLHGRHPVQNFLAAACCGLALGVPLEALPAVAAKLEATPMRGVVRRSLNGATVIDDSYNSNPEALLTALESACRLDGRRKVAILGEMLELGPRSPEFHRAAGEKAVELGFDLVIGVGSGAQPLVDAAEETAVTNGTGAVETEWLETAAEAAERAAERVRKGDVVLVKGSRGVGLEIVVERLCEELSREGA